jgi:hypothetical protein
LTLHRSQIIPFAGIQSSPAQLCHTLSPEKSSLRGLRAPYMSVQAVSSRLWRSSACTETTDERRKPPCQDGLFTSAALCSPSPSLRANCQAGMHRYKTGSVFTILSRTCLWYLINNHFAYHSTAPTTTVTMKAVSLLPLLAAGTIAAPASSTDSTVPSLTKNRGEYNFELYVKEYCNTDPASTKPEVHAYAEFSHGDSYEYGWACEKSSPRTFTLNDVSISVRHDPDTSETFFESGDCKWKDGDTAKESCGWCDRGVQWIGFDGARQIDCSTRSELSRVSNYSATLRRYRFRLTTSSTAR